MLANSGASSGGGVQHTTGMTRADDGGISAGEALPEGRNFDGVVEKTDNPVYDTSKIFEALEKKAEVRAGSRPISSPAEDRFADAARARQSALRCSYRYRCPTCFERI